MDYIDKIKEARISAGETQASMAALLKTTRQQYSKYENKTQELPIRHLVTICSYLGLSADSILKLSNEVATFKRVYELKKKETEASIKLAQAELELLVLKEKLKEMEEKQRKNATNNNSRSKEESNE